MHRLRGQGQAFTTSSPPREQSWNQRLRWAKGFTRCFHNYGGKLVTTMFPDRNFSCFDMLMTISPAMIASLLTVSHQRIFPATRPAEHHDHPWDHSCDHQRAGWPLLCNFTLVLYAFGLLTTIPSGKRSIPPLGRRSGTPLLFRLYLYLCAHLHCGPVPQR